MRMHVSSRPGRPSGEGADPYRRAVRHFEVAARPTDALMLAQLP